METSRASQGGSPAAASTPLHAHASLSYSSAPSAPSAPAASSASSVPSAATSPALQHPIASSSVLATLPSSLPPPQRPLRKACDECHLIKVKCTPLTASSDVGPSSPQVNASSPPCSRNSDSLSADAERIAPMACQRCHRLSLTCRFSPADIKTRRKRRKKEADHHDTPSTSTSATQTILKEPSATPRDDHASSVQGGCPWDQTSPSACVDASRLSSGTDAASSQLRGTADRASGIASPFALNFPTPPSVQDFEANEWEGWFRDLPMFAPSLALASAQNGTLALDSNGVYSQNGIASSKQQPSSTYLSNEASATNAALGANTNGNLFNVEAGAMATGRGFDEKAGGEPQDQESIMRMLFGLDPCFAPRGVDGPSKDLASAPLQRSLTSSVLSSSAAQSTASNDTSLSPWAPSSGAASQDTSQLPQSSSFEASHSAQSSPSREPSLQDLANAALLQRPPASAESDRDLTAIAPPATMATSSDSPRTEQASMTWSKSEGAVSQGPAAQSSEARELKRMPPDRSIEARLSSLSLDFSAALDLCDPIRISNQREEQAVQRQQPEDPASPAARATETKRREGESRLLPLFVRADELWEEMVWWGSVRVGKAPGSAGPRAGQRIQRPLSPAASMLTLSLSFQMLDALRLLSAIIDSQSCSREATRGGGGIFAAGDTIPACRPFLASASGFSTSLRLSSLISPYRLHSSSSTPTTALISSSKDAGAAQTASRTSSEFDPNAQASTTSSSGTGPADSLTGASLDSSSSPASASASVATAQQPPCFPLPTTLHLPLLTALRDHYMSRFTSHLSTIIDQARVWHDVGENMGRGPHGHCAVQVQGARVLRGLDDVRRGSAQQSYTSAEAGAGSEKGHAGQR